MGVLYIYRTPVDVELFEFLFCSGDQIFELFRILFDVGKLCFGVVIQSEAPAAA